MILSDWSGLGFVHDMVLGFKAKVSMFITIFFKYHKEMNISTFFPQKNQKFQIIAFPKITVIFNRLMKLWP